MAVQLSRTLDNIQRALDKTLDDLKKADMEASEVDLDIVNENRKTAFQISYKLESMSSFAKQYQQGIEMKYKQRKAASGTGKRIASTRKS